MSDDAGFDTRLESIVTRALEFQRYIFRRAWGIYYAVWAAAIAGFSFSYPILQMLGLAQILPWEFYALFYGGIAVVAAFASYLIFMGASRATYLRRALKPLDPKQMQRWRLYGLWWLAFYAAIGISFALFGNYALTILYVLLLSVPSFIYIQLRRSFPDKVPIEGKLALGSYFVSDLVSLVASFYFPNSGLVDFVWLVTVALWFFASVYSLSRAPEELTALVY